MIVKLTVIELNSTSYDVINLDISTTGDSKTDNIGLSSFNFSIDLVFSKLSTVAIVLSKLALLLLFFSEFSESVSSTETVISVAILDNFLSIFLV